MSRVDIQDGRGINTPLHLVTGGDHLQMIETLVQTKTDVDSQDELGHTPLDLTLVSDREQRATLLRTHSVRIGSEVSMGEEKEEEKMRKRKL